MVTFEELLVELVEFLHALDTTSSPRMTRKTIRRMTAVKTKRITTPIITYLRVFEVGLTAEEDDF